MSVRECIEGVGQALLGKGDKDKGRHPEKDGNFDYT